MSDTNVIGQTGWCKLWHPRGPQVSIPLPVGQPAELLAVVSSYLDAGFLVAAPGLEADEEKEQVGWVLRQMVKGRNGEVPLIVMYSSNDAVTWPILKEYLNTKEDVLKFEYASGVKVEDIPVYVGNDRPQRGAKSTTDKFIIKCPPFGVISKANPKHDPNEKDVKKMKPKRLFVRWENQRPAEQPAPATQQPAALTPQQQALAQDWKDWMATVVNASDFSVGFREHYLKLPDDDKAVVKPVVWEEVKRRGWKYDHSSNGFISQQTQEVPF